METFSISSVNPSIDLIHAREKAVAEAKKRITEPVIVAWKDDNRDTSAPEIPGGKDERRHDYGENYRGQLELTVGNNYHFIFTDSSAFGKPDINLKSISTENGAYFLCLDDACTDEDRKQYGAPYGGGLGDG
jgi:hypothetical protein